MRDRTSEAAGDHIRNAAQILAQPLTDLAESDLAAVRARLQQALAEVEALIPVGVGIEIDFERRSYTVVRRFKRVVAQSTNYAQVVETARRLRAELRGRPSITLHTQRPTMIAARGD